MTLAWCSWMKLKPKVIYSQKCRLGQKGWLEAVRRRRGEREGGCNFIISMEEFSPLKMKNMTRYFPGKEVDSRVILQAFKLQENKRAMSTYRTKQLAFEQRVEEEVQKMDLLKVTGKEVHSLSPPTPRTKTHKQRGARGGGFEGPLEVVQQKLSQELGRDHFEYDLGELKKVTMSSAPQAILLPPFEQAREAGREEGRSRMQDYEQMILNNPALYRRVMAAYNNTKRKLDKDSMQLQLRRGSLKRETAYEGRFVPPRSGHLPKCHSEVRKLSSMALFRELQVAVGLTNRLVVHPPPEGQYKACVCRGNNSTLIKSLLKSRPWWAIRSASEADASHLVWSEWRKKRVLRALPTAESRYSGEEGRGEYEVQLASKKREYVLLADKKAANMERLVSRRDWQVWRKFEAAPHSENYLTSTHRLSDSSFPQQSARVYPPPQYCHLSTPKSHRMHNHLPGCLQLNSKKLLFLNLQRHYASTGRDVFSVLPLTFLITKGANDPEFLRFSQHFEHMAPLSRGKGRETHNIWICKPGENSNRGHGIDILNSLGAVRALAEERCSGGRTLVVQKYLESPFLYNRRKFDIRCFVLVTTVRGVVKGYWYEEGYLRTAVKEFQLKALGNKFVHLTNDAVQQRSEDYGKFENHNKVTYADFAKHLETNGRNPQHFELAQHQMKQIATELIRAVAPQLNPQRREFAFELYGLDFILDDNLRPFLIEANSNPSLDATGLVLGRIVPALLENLLRVAVDPVFPPPLSEAQRARYSPPGSSFESNKFVLVYDSYFEGPGQRDGEPPSEKELGEDEEDHEGELD